MTALDQLFAKVRAENRAALIAYIPAGFPSQAGCHRVIAAFIAGGVDAIEIGYPYSDPVMDGPTIQAAAVTSLANGTGAAEVLAALKFASASVPAVVMTYWNPIERFGVAEFAKAIATNGGSGVITPDLTIEESAGWIKATKESSINPIYLPVAVGLGVSTREQAKGVAAFADGVIVGSAFIKALQDAPSEEAGLLAVTELARELAKGVREGR